MILSTAMVLAALPAPQSIHFTVPEGFLLLPVDDITGDGVPELLATKFFGGNPAGVVLDGRLGVPVIDSVGDPAAPFGYQGVTSGVLGDVDGDGTNDFALGGPLSGAGGLAVLSGADGTSLHSSVGAWGSSYGASMADVGDWNRDGRDEYAVTATSAGARGELYVYDAASFTRILTLLPPPGVQAFGVALTPYGDTNGDGRVELLVGVPLSSEVLLLDLAQGTVLRRFTSPIEDDEFGGSLALAGDIDGDGEVDLFVGAPGTHSFMAPGRVEARSGRDGALLWSRTGIPHDNLGASLAVIGDVDGDAVGDLVVGAPEDYFVLGAGNGYVEMLSGASGAVLGKWRAPSGRAFGRSVAALGDIDGDGALDFAVGGRDGLVSRGFVLSTTRRSLDASTAAISIPNGGSQELFLDAGFAHAGSPYVVFGSASGTEPPTPYGGTLVPLRFDRYTRLVATFANSGQFQSTVGHLDQAGRATARLDFPSPTPALVGVTLHHAFVAAPGAANAFASNAVPLTFVP